jgi:hypothetical protein
MDDRNMPTSDFPVFLSSNFLSFFPACESGVSGDGGGAGEPQTPYFSNAPHLTNLALPFLSR